MKFASGPINYQVDSLCFILSVNFRVGTINKLPADFKGRAEENNDFKIPPPPKKRPCFEKNALIPIASSYQIDTLSFILSPKFRGWYRNKVPKT